MANKRKTQTDQDDLAGTVEGQARDYFEREKAAYEKRTGQTVEFVPPMPETRTPIESEAIEAEQPSDEEPTATEGQEETQSEGD